MKSYNLQFYVDKIVRNEKFSLIRFGDGEMLCMWGKKGGNSNGCRYSPELREALLKSMEIKDEQFIYGMQRVLPNDKERFEREYPSIEFHDSEIWGEAVANGELFPFLDCLKLHNLVIVGNLTLKPLAKKLKAIFIEVPPFNAYDIPYPIPKNFCKNTVILFCCGMASNAWISQHWDKDNWYLDVGHIFDPLVGIMSRCDLEGKTLEDMQKNYEKN